MRTDYFNKDIMQPASEAGVSPQAYWVKHNKIKEYLFLCVCEIDGGWEHISVSLRSFKESKKGKMVERTPTWGEMCYIKDLFWDKDEVAIQFHPVEGDYVNLHNYCLHLWKPIQDNDFLKECNEQRELFANRFGNGQFAELKTDAESLLIMYDQMQMRLKEFKQASPI